jgi:hypothetical protein
MIWPAGLQLNGEEEHEHFGRFSRNVNLLTQFEVILDIYHIHK